MLELLLLYIIGKTICVGQFYWVVWAILFAYKCFTFSADVYINYKYGDDEENNEDKENEHV